MMKMSDVRVGMRLKSTQYDHAHVITVTELTARGFRYAHPPRTIKLGYRDGIPEFGTTEGGEHYVYDGECHYEEILDGAIHPTQE